MHRGAVPLASQEAVLVTPTVLNVSVPSCNGEPVVDRLEENEHQVAVRVVATVVSGTANLCIDGLDIELREPLDDRPLIDLHSGDVLHVLHFGGVTTTELEQAPAR